MRGKHLSYKRSRKIQKPSVSLLRIGMRERERERDSCKSGKGMRTDLA